MLINKLYTLYKTQLQIDQGLNISPDTLNLTKETV